MHKILKEGQTPVKSEAYGVRHPEDHHWVISGRITGNDPYHHH